MKKRWITLVTVLALLLSCIGAAAPILALGEDPQLSFVAGNLAFKDSIYVELAVEAKYADTVSLLVWNGARETYEYGTQTATVTGGERRTVLGTDCTVFKFTGIAAKQMADDFYFRAYTEKGGKAYYSPVKKYGVMTYAYNKLGKTGTASDDQKLISLLNGLLHYGSLTQTYLNYHTDRLADGTYYEIAVSGGTLADGTDRGLFAVGDSASLCAPLTDENGNGFSHWADNAGNKIGYTASLNVTATATNAIYTAVYRVASAGLEFDVQDDEAIVTGLGECTDTDIIIPSKHQGYPVTAIDISAFAGEDITSVTIPASVKDIGKKAFYNCSELTDVYYEGTAAQWEEITVAANNNSLDNAEHHFADDIYYTVTFKDWDGKVLKTESVKDGNAATPPANPAREGYTFSGWDKAYDTITADTVLTAQYVAALNGVRFSFDAPTAKSGEEFALALSVESSENAVADGLIVYDLVYDDTKLEFLGFDDYGELITGSLGKTDSVEVENRRINLGYNPAIAANGKICQLKFKVKDTVAAQTQVTVSMSAAASKGRLPLSGVTVTAPSCTLTVQE